MIWIRRILRVVGFLLAGTGLFLLGVDVLRFMGFDWGFNPRATVSLLILVAGVIMIAFARGGAGETNPGAASPRSRYQPRSGRRGYPRR